MITLKLTVALVLVSLAWSKGVTEWCVHRHKYLRTYSSGTNVYTRYSTAKSECLKRSDCFGITRQGGNRFTLRKDWVLRDSESGEVSYVPCAGYFTCATFGLKSVHGKFLSAQPNGDVEWNRSRYGGWEQITFEQHGVNTGFLRSYHNKYLAATNKERLEWNRPYTRGWEKFKVYQYEDKIALQSSHGKYLSAQSDGSVDVNREWKRTWEWFTVHPQSCLNNIRCDCSKDINENDYELESINYHSAEGSVDAYPPERVGFQNIDNRNSSTEQSTTFSVSNEVTETASFSHTAGASVTVGTEFRTGIPVIASGSVSVEVSAHYEFSSGIEYSETKTIQADYNCNAPPGKTVRCEALLFKYKARVPYTQVWRHKRLPCTCSSSGVFEELAAHEMRLVIEED